MTNETSISPLNPIPGSTSAAPSVPLKKRRSPSAKRAETKARKETDRGFPLPLTLKCTVTGKVVKYTSLNYIRKLIAKYKTVEALQQNYVSVEGRKTTPTS